MQVKGWKEGKRKRTVAPRDAGFQVGRGKGSGGTEEMECPAEGEEQESPDGKRTGDLTTDVLRVGYVHCKTEGGTETREIRNRQLKYNEKQ